MKTFEFEGIEYDPNKIQYVNDIISGNDDAWLKRNMYWFYIVFNFIDDDYIIVENKDIDKLKEQRAEFIRLWNEALNS